MKIFNCKCGSTDVFINKVGNNTGLYCADCGKWITWLNKDQLRLAERQISNTNELKDFVRWLWDNHYLVDETFTINLVDSYLEQKGVEE